MTVEIIGYASVAPGASSAAQLFANLRNGVCSVTEVPATRWDKARFWHPVQGTSGKTYTFAAGVVDNVHDFDPAVFGLSRREAMAMDPQQRLLLAVTWRALEDAALPLPSLHDEAVGVYVGASSLDSANLSAEDPASGGPYFMTGNTLSIVANRLSHIFGLRGPSLTIDTACSSSLVALDQAVRALTRGEIDTAIVGGVNLLNHPLPFVGFAQARMLSPVGQCRAFDNDASGYVRAEGAVAVVLRRSDKAAACGDRSRARILASGVNSAGRTNGISLPSSEAQVALLDQVYSGAGIDPNQIAFVEGHGTGTKVGDPAEVWAIGQVIGKRRHAPVPIGSIKTNIGHTEPASGLFGLIKAVMALEQNYLPASLFFETPNENIDFSDLNVRVSSTPLELLRSRRPRLAGINSFGFGGTNAHVVISDPDPSPAPLVDRDAEGYFVISAHTKTALQQLASDYRTALQAASPAKADAIVAATSAGRTLLRHRLVSPLRRGRDVEGALDGYLAEQEDAVEIGETPGAPPKIAFVFSGNGAQWVGMGVDAYRLNKTFRRHFDAASALFETHLNEKLVNLLTDDALAERLSDTRIAQPLLFSVQVALANCLLGAGIRPTQVLGHSIGEVAAAHVAGALSLVDAVAVVAARSRSQQATRGRGTMAAALCGEETGTAFLAANGLSDVVVAAVNARNSITFSGPAESIAQLRALGRKSKIAVQPLDIDYPFHHPLIDEVKQDFLTTLPKITLHVGEIGFISTVTGTSLSGKQLDGRYWWRNAREPVAFRNAVTAALDAGCNLLIEIGPRPILGNYLKETVRESAANAQVITTLGRETGAAADPVARSIARAFAHGAEEVPGTRNASITLPVLPFEPETLIVPPTTDTYDIFGRHAAQYSLAGWRADPNSTAWKNHVDAALFPDLAEHVVEGRAIMPGAGFVEMALQVARQHLGSDQVTLSNMELLSPLVLDTKLLETSTIVSSETGVIEIRSRERLSTDDWTLHAVARCSLLQLAGDDDPLPIERVERVVGHDEVYRVANDFGLEYGAVFRRLLSAATDGHRRVDVTLSASSAPVHPHLTWVLNPMSLDAAFHGLVGLFDKLSGDRDGAPYIPVRFGSISLYGAGAEVRTARIEIQKFSAHSIKARFVLADESGQVLLRIEDCRFRRTWLRQHISTHALGFHYECLPWSGGAPLPAHRGEDVLPEMVADGVDDATLLLQAAIYRTCHDIARALMNGRDSLSEMPGDATFRAFLATCLRILADAGLAENDGGVWAVEEECALPSVEELLREFQAEQPERGVEAVAVASIRSGALHHVTQLRQGDYPTPLLPSRSTVDHWRLHSAAARWRNRMVLDALSLAIQADPDRPVAVLQVGSSATGFSGQIVEMVARCGGRLIIYEPNEELRRPLQMTFESSARVLVTATAPLDAAVQVIVSTSDRFYNALEHDESLVSFTRQASETGARLLFAEAAHSSFTDFLFGLTPEWEAKGAVAGLSLGALATEREWQSLLARAGYDRTCAQAVSTPYGLMVVGDAQNSVSLKRADLEDISFVHLSTSLAEASGAARETVDIEAPDLDTRLSTLVSTRDLVSPLNFVYALPDCAKDPSGDLVREVWKITRFATSLQTVLDASRTDLLVNLLLVLPGGAPLTTHGMLRPADPVSSGLWTFARVLANESDCLAVHLVDAPLQQWQRALPLVRDASGNREWLIGDDGQSIHALRVVNGPLPATDANTLDFQAATIRQRAPSRVDTLYWEEMVPPQLSGSDVMVQVVATGLNFRDVMWAMGLLPEEALEDGFAGATIGMELSGYVTAVGADVSDLAPGDAVMGIGPAAFSTHAVIPRAGLAKVPEGIDMLAASTVPVTFLTAWYAIVELGRARAGESILIHGAAGGVGLAAVQIARILKLKVIATVGSEEKRSYLKALGVDHIFNSRSLSFVADVKRVTGGQGVDLVLNSLFSEAMEQSIGLLKPFGRFLELGKRDYYADRKIGLRPFRRNVSYFGIDADQLPLKAPELTKQIFDQLGSLFAAGDLVPLPFRLFAHSEISEAFRLMQSSGHIGKIVITPPQAGRDEVARGLPAHATIDAAGIQVVVGGIGGFGLAAADWLVNRGARRLALVTRRGVADGETLAAIERWRSVGAIGTVHACDVTDQQAVDALLDKLRAEAPIRGIVHAAMVLDDALLPNLTEERFRSVIEVKARGAEVLDRATRKDPIELFLLFSSATTMIGNPGQANYVAANGFLEGLARQRRTLGLPALAVGFGAISDHGYLAGQDSVSEILSRRLGNSSMKAETALAFVGSYIANDPGTIGAAVVMCSPIDWAIASNLSVVSTPLFEVPMRQVTVASTSGNEGLDLASLVANKSESEALDILYKLVAAEMASVLRVSENTLSKDKVLKDAGLDSLMAVELGLSFKERTGVEIPLSSVGDTTTIDQVVRKLYERVVRSSAREEDGADGAAEIEALAAQHIASQKAAEHA